MSREQSAIIKGIAILLMLIYHLNNILGINGLDNEFYNTLSRASHPITFFLIVSGYGLYFLYRQGRITWKYLFRRTLKLYLAFAHYHLLIFLFSNEICLFLFDLCQILVPINYYYYLNYYYLI